MIELLKYVALIFLGPPLLIIFIFLASFFYQFIKYTKFKGMKLKKGHGIIQKKDGVFKRLFYLFPRQLSLDIINGDPDEFKPWGVHLICGEQGSGKTITTVWLLDEWKRKYPLSQCYTNMDYLYQDGAITHWKNLFDYRNGIYGTIKVIDELPTWFSSLQSKDFPVEMLGEISQQRKQRSAIIGTAQLFNRVGKPIREQTHFVYLPITILGVLTIVRKSKVQYWNEDKQRFTKYTGIFFLIQTPKLRGAFDTLKKIDKYAEDGFYSNPQFLPNGGSVK